MSVDKIIAFSLELRMRLLYELNEYLTILMSEALMTFSWECQKGVYSHARLYLYFFARNFKFLSSIIFKQSDSFEK